MQDHGVGKTTLALQIALNLAKRGTGVGFISLEMSNIQIMQKIISNKTGINAYKFRTGQIENEEFEKIGLKLPEIYDMPIYINTSLRSIQEIETFTRKHKKDIKVLIIDYIQLMKNDKKFGSREQEVADISRTLKLLSLDLNIPIVALCQLNRNANRNEPTLADLRESGSLEQDADNVIFLYNEEENETENPIITLKIAKQRAGSIGKTKIRFMKSINEFRNLERGV